MILNFQQQSTDWKWLCFDEDVIEVTSFDWISRIVFCSDGSSSVFLGKWQPIRPTTQWIIAFGRNGRNSLSQETEFDWIWFNCIGFYCFENSFGWVKLSWVQVRLNWIARDQVGQISIEVIFDWLRVVYCWLDRIWLRRDFDGIELNCIGLC